MRVDFGRLLSHQVTGHSCKKGFRRVVLRFEEQDEKRRPDSLQVRAYGKLLVIGEGRADDGEVIVAHGGTPYRLISGYDKVGGITGLGEEVRS